MTSYGEKILKIIENFFKTLSYYLPTLPNYPTYYYIIAGIIILAIFIFIYSTINNNFKKKYGYPIVDKLSVGLVSATGIFVYAGVFWREYAIDKKTDLLFPNIFLGFFILCFLLFWLMITVVYYKEKRAAGWFNSLLALLGFLFLFLFTGIIVCIWLFFIVGSIFVGASGGKRKSYTNSYNEELANRYLGEKSAGIHIKRSDDF